MEVENTIDLEMEVDGEEIAFSVERDRDEYPYHLECGFAQLAIRGLTDTDLSSIRSGNPGPVLRRIESSFRDFRTYYNAIIEPLRSICFTGKLNKLADLPYEIRYGESIDYDGYYIVYSRDGIIINFSTIDPCIIFSHESDCYEDFSFDYSPPNVGGMIPTINNILNVARSVEPVARQIIETGLVLKN